MRNAPLIDDHWSYRCKSDRSTFFFLDILPSYWQIWGQISWALIWNFLSALCNYNKFSWKFLLWISFVINAKDRLFVKELFHIDFNSFVNYSDLLSVFENICASNVSHVLCWLELFHCIVQRHSFPIFTSQKTMFKKRLYGRIHSDQVERPLKLKVDAT